jgi:transcriptional regulator with XRE-family HTH domain
LTERNPLGDFIKERRSALGLSLRDLAIQSGVSHSYLNNLERGTDYSTGKPTNPTVDKLAMVAKGLKVSPDVLIGILRGTPVPAYDVGTMGWDVAGGYDVGTLDAPVPQSPVPDWWKAIPAAIRPGPEEIEKANQLGPWAPPNYDPRTDKTFWFWRRDKAVRRRLFALWEMERDEIEGHEDEGIG